MDKIKSKEFTAFTDGACSGNPGSGGYGLIIFNKNGDVVYAESKSSKDTTNNREELKAIVAALKIREKIMGLPENDGVAIDFIINSDSAYCVNSCNTWIWGWARHNWVNSKKEQVKNIDLMKTLYNYINTNFFSCQICKVKGHSGVLGNEIADALATRDDMRVKKLLTGVNINLLS